MKWRVHETNRILSEARSFEHQVIYLEVHLAVATISFLNDPKQMWFLADEWLCSTKMAYTRHTNWMWPCLMSTHDCCDARYIWRYDAINSENERWIWQRWAPHRFLSSLTFTQTWVFFLTSFKSWQIAFLSGISL